MKKLLLAAVFFFALICTTLRADDSASDSDLKQLMILEGAAIASSLIIANDPKPWGTALVALSPILAAATVEGEFSWSRYLVGVAVIGGIGAWLRSMEDESNSTVSARVILGYNVLILPMWIYSGEGDAKQNASRLSLNFDLQKDQMALSYSVRF